jgi:hypothetical protein
MILVWYRSTHVSVCLSETDPLSVGSSTGAGKWTQLPMLDRARRLARAAYSQVTNEIVVTVCALLHLPHIALSLSLSLHVCISVHMCNIHRVVVKTITD